MVLDGKTIIVTGASSGIGAEAARCFATEGANVVLGARRAALLEGLAGEIGRIGGQAACLAGDVGDGQYAADLVALATERFGGLDGAFNNAGIVGEMGPVPDMDEDNWQKVISTNLTSGFYAAKHQIPPIAKRGGGSIVFTSSFVGHTIGLPGMGAYAASKAGLIGMTQVLAAEHGADNIRVNALLPGGTRTEMAGDDPQTHEWVSSLHALKRMADPSEIAQAALFLISDRSSFVTGSALIADGGNSINKT
ncbi:SDR family oxidoreductase [Hoeflea prorocentri]|uniref:SDR family oxidoreductase n=1 Tax=Hoeflea prorocentri TaxID=1922333 RepID=A0A9X3ZIC7_9HYPH|nr:SDR family oxidoreductase [Hoeflea prorocentri]MCY6382304.1 SDR family oxidoreductase [Hoeflea prorocentri]MDA5400104.1 SDR family oxidoreductase [Hoeflea prorocentri]